MGGTSAGLGRGEHTCEKKCMCRTSCEGGHQKRESRALDAPLHMRILFDLSVLCVNLCG